MRENDRAPVVELEVSKTPTYIMKPSPIKEKPAAWRLYTNNCIALDRLVEVALSPTGLLDSRFRNNAGTPKNQVPRKIYTKTPKSAGSRDGSRDGEGDDGDSAEKRRYCCSNGIKLAQPAAPSPSPSPSPSSEAPNHQSAGYFQQQQQQQKLKRRLSSFNEISPPAGRSSSSLRVHVEHPHAKRFKLTPRFKALVDISC